MPQNPVARRLQVKAGQALVVLDAPQGFREMLEPLPDGVRWSTTLRGEADVILAFFRTRREVRERITALKRAFAPGGILWICYPKLTSSLAGELNRDLLWKDLAPHGLRPVAMVSIDATWSAMRFKRLS